MKAENSKNKNVVMWDCIRQPLEGWCCQGLGELLFIKIQHGLKKIFKIVLVKVLPLESSQEQFYVESYTALLWVISKIHEELYAEHDTSEPIIGFENDLGLERIL